MYSSTSIFDDSLNLLKEIHRILKPNGTLRLSVPSLEFRMQCYLDAKKDQASIPLATEHIRKLTQEFLHLSVWDFDRLCYALQEIGLEIYKNPRLVAGEILNLFLILKIGYMNRSILKQANNAKIS